MLLLNLTEEQNLTGVVLLIGTRFARYLFDTMYYQFEQVSSVTVEPADQCKKSVQITVNKKITRISLTSSTGIGKYMNM